MPVHNIAVREDVYDRLARAKRQGESFSEEIDRLLQRRGRLSDFVGALAGTPEIERIAADIAQGRKLARSRT